MHQEEQRKKEKASAAAASAAAAASSAAASAVAAAASSSSSGGGAGGSDGDLRSVRKDYWLQRGLVVKVVDKKVGGGRFYKSKGRVEEVVERYVAVLRMLDGSDAKIQIDQDDLETVIPKVGGAVRVVNGRGRGLLGAVESIDVDAYCVSVRLGGGAGAGGGRLLTRVEYEDVCKVELADEAAAS